MSRGKTLPPTVDARAESIWYVRTPKRILFLIAKQLAKRAFPKRPVLGVLYELELEMRAADDDAREKSQAKPRRRAS